MLLSRPAASRRPARRGRYREAGPGGEQGVGLGAALRVHRSPPLRSGRKHLGGLALVHHVYYDASTLNADLITHHAPGHSA